MNPSAAVQNSRLRRVLLVVLLVIGTVLGLLLAHTDDTHHAVEASASVTHAHAAEESAAWWDGESTSAGSPESTPLEDALALCLTVASCFIALLLAVFGVRRLPQAWRALARSFTGPPVGMERIFRPRQVERRLLCVYLI